MNKDQIMEAIENMTVLELSELVKAMEEKFGVSAAAPAVAVAAAGAAPAEGAAAVGQNDGVAMGSLLGGLPRFLVGNDPVILCPSYQNGHGQRGRLQKARRITVGKSGEIETGQRPI